MPLSFDERTRYDRQLMLPEIGESGQEKLRAGSVLVVGAGGLAAPVLSYLVGGGVGRVGVLDGDVVELSNLHRQTSIRRATLAGARLSALPGVSRRSIRT